MTDDHGDKTFKCVTLKKGRKMKRILIALVVMLTLSASASAMSYEQARREALFLTDKMAYELNLTPEQYDAAYEINLDYLMGVTGVDDVYSAYWTRRNLDLSYVLLDWQWNAFRSASYFYKPLYWDGGYWHFGVYARYPRRHFYYFDRPTVYVSYRGGHGWHANGGRSFYYGRRDEFRRPGNELGMRDRWDRGDFSGARRDNGYEGNRSDNRFQGARGNSADRDTRTATGAFGGARSTSTGVSNSRFSSSTGGSRTTGSFGGARTNSGVSASGSSTSSVRGSFGGSRSASTTVSTPSRSSSSVSGSFGGSRSASTTVSTPSRPSSSVSGSFGGSRSTGSFGGGSTSRPAGGSVQRGSFGGSR